MSKDFWTAPKLWPGADVFIIGGGTSLDDFDFNKLKNKWTIGCNDAYKLGGDIVDVVTFGDSGWFNIHRESGLLSFPGLIVTAHSCGLEEPNKVKVLKRRPVGIQRDPDKLGWNSNTGAMSINLAYHFGASRIFLLGFDMQLSEDKRANWHVNLKDQPKKESYKTFLDNFEKHIFTDYEAIGGFEIINTNPDSALTLFPFMELEAVL